VDRLAGPYGFTRQVEDVAVSSSETILSDLIYEEGQRFYEHLQSLSPNSDEVLAVVHQHFSERRGVAPVSHVRAYRKNERSSNAA
jgi:hypothetical protein